MSTIPDDHTHDTVASLIECEHPECIELLTPEPYRLHTAKLGDAVLVTLKSGNTYEMKISQVHAPGSAGRSFSAGPHVVAHIRPGGYSINLDSPEVSAVVWRYEDSPE